MCARHQEVGFDLKAWREEHSDYKCENYSVLRHGFTFAMHVKVFVAMMLVDIKNTKEDKYRRGDKVSERLNVLRKFYTEKTYD